MKFSAKLVTLFALGIIPAPMQADLLEPIIIRDNLIINPNIEEPEEYTRVRTTSADGGDFLNQINGVSISRFGGRGLEPIIRGQTQTRLNILLDGAYVHGGCPNRMDPPASWAALETYEKVEVMKGVQTLIYGGGGSGGTVLFERDSRSLAEEEGVHGRVSVTGSTNGLKGGIVADVMAAGEKGYIRFFSELKKHDNYEDGDGREVRSAFTHKQGGVVIGYTPTEDRLIELTIERNDFEDALYPGAGMDSPTEEGTFYKLRYLDKPDVDWLDSIKLEAYYTSIDHVMDNFSLRTPPPLPMQRKVDTTSDTSGGRLILDSSTDNTAWKYGLDLQRNVRNAAMFNNMLPPAELMFMWPDVTTQQIGMFAEATTKLDEKRRLVYGLRYDRVTASADNASVAVGPMGVIANNSYQTYYGPTANGSEKQENNLGGLLRYEVDLSNEVTFFTGLSRSVRTADSTERFMNKWSPTATMRWVGNPNIQPEKHHQLDIGVIRSSTTYNFGATLFYDHISDYILRDVAAAQPGILLADGAEIYRNVDARLWGIELEGSMQVTDKLELTAAIAYVNATNTTDNRPIAQTPPLNGKLQLDYDGGRWNLGSRVRFADAQNRIDTISKQEVGQTPGWGIVDLYGSYTLNDTFTLRYGVENLLDKTYAEHASRSNLLDPVALKVNEPGRSAWLRLTAEF